MSERLPIEANAAPSANMNAGPVGVAPLKHLPRALNLKIELADVAALAPSARNARTHSKKQIAQISASYRQFGIVSPILLGDDNTIIAGHGRVLAAKSLGLTEIPSIKLSHLTSEERRALMLADNRLAELAGWDHELLAIELQSLSELELQFDLEITGFDGADLDRLLGAGDKPRVSEDDEPPALEEHAVSRLGDVWIMGDHRLICGSALSPTDYDRLMEGQLARMVFTDPPYNVPIEGHVSGKGKADRREFVMASGEMTTEAFSQFLQKSLSAAARVSCDGSIHFVCMDWRHLTEVIEAGKAAIGEWKNLIAWVKDNGGMGTFYRSQHELVLVFKKGQAPHINNFGLGETGRYRTNVWRYPGVNTFSADRDEALAMHPTVKPLALVSDAIKDVSKRKDIVLDPFGGSGTTLIAAQKTGRRARLIELDPLYCDVICRRWIRFTGQQPVLEDGKGSFEAVSADREVRDV